MGGIAFIEIAIGFNPARVWLGFLLCVLVVGCREKPDQVAVEYNTAGFLLSQIQFYENQFPNVPMTNLQQVLTGVGVPYPARWHHQLRSFGKYAGFQNSLCEKYVFIPNRFTNRVIGGEIVLLNAEPFPDQKGKAGRIIFSKWRPGWDGWMSKWYPEQQVQQIFREAGQSIPKAVPLPPPSELPPPYQPPLRARVEGYFVGVTRNLGLGTGAGILLMYITFGVLGMVALVFVAIFWGQRLKRKNKLEGTAHVERRDEFP